MLGLGKQQEAGNNNNLEEQVHHDASYQRTVKGQVLADPSKEALTLQGTIGIPGCHHLSCQSNAGHMPYRKTQLPAESVS